MSLTRDGWGNAENPYWSRMKHHYWEISRLNQAYARGRCGLVFAVALLSDSQTSGDKKCKRCDASH